MPVEDGYTRYACDRQWNAHSDMKVPANFLLPGSKAADDWHEVEHIDANGAPVKVELCEECYEKYIEMKKRHDEEFYQFLYEGVNR